jgi:hypothetical protein
MWPFKPRDPAPLKFKVGDPVFFKIFPHGTLFEGTVRSVTPGMRFAYVVEADGIQRFAEVEEELMRPRGADNGTREP